MAKITDILDEQQQKLVPLLKDKIPHASMNISMLNRRVNLVPRGRDHVEALYRKIKKITSINYTHNVDHLLNVLIIQAQDEAEAKISQQCKNSECLLEKIAMETKPLAFSIMRVKLAELGLEMTPDDILALALLYDTDYVI